MENNGMLVFRRLFAAFFDFVLFQTLWSLSLQLTIPIIGWEAFINWIVEGDIGIEDEITAAFAAYTIVSALLGVIVGILYYAYVPWIKDGKTLGKSLMGVKVVDERGRNPSVLKHMLRAIMLWGIYAVTPLSLTILIDPYIYTLLTGSVGTLFYTVVLAGMFMIVFGRDARGPHDRLAKTRIVDENFEPSWEMIEPDLRKEDWAAKETIDRKDDFLYEYDKRDPWKK